MTTLQQILTDFSEGRIGLSEQERKNLLTGNGYDFQEAPEVFKDIAHALLNGCFAITSDDKTVRVIPTCVEIYYHEEEPDGVKDPIVYHRNTKSNEKVPLFPFGTLHNHVSGIDITFESERHGKTRASALIREFKIENGQDIEKWGMKETETRSTYIYAAIFSQFNIFDGFSVRWEDMDNPKEIGNPTHRKNVMQYDAEGNKIEKVQDPRCWQFRLTQ